MRFALLLGLAACGGVDSDQTRDLPAYDGPVVDSLRVAFQSRVDGEIEPCG